MNWLMCLDINFIPQNNFSCEINTMNCKFICQLKKKRCMEWYKTMLYFQSYITCILIIFSQNVISRKYFLQIEYSWTWNHKKISQRAVEHELQLNCCLFLCFEYTDFFPQYNKSIQSFNDNAAENVHWNTEHRKIMSSLYFPSIWPQNT